MEYLTERGSVFLQNVHTLTPNTTSVMELAMKRRNVMISAVQVCNIASYLTSYSLLVTWNYVLTFVYIQNQITLVNGQHGVNAVPVVERAKNTARGYVTSQSVQQITEDAKETTMNMLIVMPDVVQVSRPAIQTSKYNLYILAEKLTIFSLLARMAIGLHGQTGVNAQ